LRADGRCGQQCRRDRDDENRSAGHESFPRKIRLA
jgi:hypothetical protein